MSLHYVIVLIPILCRSAVDPSQYQGKHNLYLTFFGVVMILDLDPIHWPASLDQIYSSL